MVGRLKPGVTLAQAREDADRVAQETMRNFRPGSSDRLHITSVVNSLKEHHRSGSAAGPHPVPRRCRRAAHRLRQSRRAAAGSRHSPPPRNRGPPRARRSSATLLRQALLWRASFSASPAAFSDCCSPPLRSKSVPASCRRSAPHRQHSPRLDGRSSRLGSPFSPACSAAWRRPSPRFAPASTKPSRKAAAPALPAPVTRASAPASSSPRSPSPSCCSGRRACCCAALRRCARPISASVPTTRRGGLQPAAQAIRHAGSSRSVQPGTAAPRAGSAGRYQRRPHVLLPANGRRAIGLRC